MAKETIIQLFDDINGGEAVTTIQFAWDGSAYEIDLNAKNAKAFEQAIAPYVASARRLTAARRGPSKKTAVASAKHDLTAVRAWAAKNGHKIAARGRIPAAVTDAFHAAEAGLTSAASDIASTVKPANKTATRTATKKTPAKKTPAKKAPAKKSPARKAVARKAAAKKPAR